MKVGAQGLSPVQRYAVEVAHALAAFDPVLSELAVIEAVAHDADKIAQAFALGESAERCARRVHQRLVRRLQNGERRGG